QMVRSVGFDSSYSFKYSDRPGVRAARMEPKVPEEVKAERLQQLQQLQEDLTTRSLERLVGAEVTVLVEGPSPKQGRKNSQWRGKEPGGRVVNLESPEPVDLSGFMASTRITAAKKHSVSGEVIGRPC
ncbi:MAG: TRAM domain-containing protein, partial [Desulfohalobiaceae bacterium]